MIKKHTEISLALEGGQRVTVSISHDSGRVVVSGAREVHVAGSLAHSGGGQPLPCFVAVDNDLPLGVMSVVMVPGDARRSPLDASCPRMVATHKKGEGFVALVSSQKVGASPHDQTIPLASSE